MRVTEPLFDCPSLDESQFDGEIMLQNLPSIVAVKKLDPRPGEIVLDMCAAPGGKTTHIATLMNNRESKVKTIHTNVMCVISYLHTNAT